MHAALQLPQGPVQQGAAAEPGTVPAPACPWYALAYVLKLHLLQPRLRPAATRSPLVIQNSNLVVPPDLFDFLSYW